MQRRLVVTIVAVFGECELTVQGGLEMFWKRLTGVVLLGTSCCVFGAGCSVVNALVSSEAGSGASRNSPERMAAIGRVFENQGHYAQAEVMYRRVLRVQPDNQLAQQRLQSVVQRARQKRLSSPELVTAEALAMADSLKAASQGSHVASQRPGQSKSPRPQVDNQSTINVVGFDGDPEAAGPSVIQADIRAFEPGMPSEQSKDAAIEPAVPLLTAAADTVSSESAESTEEVPPVVDDELGIEDDFGAAGLPADSDAATGLIATSEPTEDSETQHEMQIVARQTGAPVPSAQSETGQTAEEQTAEEQTTESSPVKPVAFSGIVSSDDDRSAWKTTSRRVSLNEVLVCLEQPTEHEKELLTALRLGEDAGVRSLAATALADCGGQNVVDELRGAAASDEDLVRVAALESLTSRGQLDEENVLSLLELISGRSPDVRTQAAGCLRYLVTSEWKTQCADGLAKLLDDDDAAVAAMAATTLGDFGDAASPYRRKLQRLAAESGESFLAEAAGHALTRIPDSNDISADEPELHEEDTAGHVFLPVIE